MPSPFKVHELLTRSELDALETFCREPGRTVDETHQWLLERGFNVSHGAVGNWLRIFKGQLLQERFSGSAELAASIKSAVAGGQMQDVADAAAMQLTQVVFEQAAQLQSDGKIDALEVRRMTQSLVNLVDGKRRIEQLKGEIRDAVSAAADAAKSGASGESVVKKVREILGIDAGEERA